MLSPENEDMLEEEVFICGNLIAQASPQLNFPKSNEKPPRKRARQPNFSLKAYNGSSSRYSNPFSKPVRATNKALKGRLSSRSLKLSKSLEKEAGNEEIFQSEVIYSKHPQKEAIGQQIHTKSLLRESKSTESNDSKPKTSEYIRKELEGWVQSFLSKPSNENAPFESDWDPDEQTATKLRKFRKIDETFVLGDRQGYCESTAEMLGRELESLSEEDGTIDKKKLVLPVRDRLHLHTIQKLEKKIHPKFNRAPTEQMEVEVEGEANTLMPKSQQPDAQLLALTHEFNKEYDETVDMYSKCSEDLTILRKYLEGQKLLLWDSDEDFLLREGDERIVHMMSRYKTQSNIDKRRVYLSI